MKFPLEDDRLAVNTGTPVARDQYQNGLRLEADYSTLYVTSSTAGAFGNQPNARQYLSGDRHQGKRSAR